MVWEITHMLSAKSDAIGLLDKAFFPTFFLFRIGQKKERKKSRMYSQKWSNPIKKALFFSQYWSLPSTHIPFKVMSSNKITYKFGTMVTLAPSPDKCPNINRNDGLKIWISKLSCMSARQEFFL